MAGTDELRRLEADLAADEAVRARFDEAVRGAAEAGAQSEAEAVAAAAAGLGYRVAVADLERSSAGAEEIDLDDLQGVAGGMVLIDSGAAHGHEAYCAFSYICFDSFVQIKKVLKWPPCRKDYFCSHVGGHYFPG